MWCEFDQNIHEILQEKKFKKKNKKQTKFSFLCLTPVLPKGVSISVAFFYCDAHWTLEVQTVAQEVWVSWEGRTVRALLCPPLYCVVNLRVNGTSGLQRF